MCPYPRTQSSFVFPKHKRTCIQEWVMMEINHPLNKPISLIGGFVKSSWISHEHFAFHNVIIISLMCMVQNKHKGKWVNCVKYRNKSLRDWRSLKNSCILSQAFDGYCSRWSCITHQLAASLHHEWEVENKEIYCNVHADEFHGAWSPSSKQPWPASLKVSN